MLFTKLKDGLARNSQENEQREPLTMNQMAGIHSEDEVTYSADETYIENSKFQDPIIEKET